MVCPQAVPVLNTSSIAGFISQQLFVGPSLLLRMDEVHGPLWISHVLLPDFCAPLAR